MPESAGQNGRVVQGTIRQVGGAPNVSTRLETEDGPVLLRGPLSVEIARAAGAVARVRGTTGDDDPDVIQVERYELVSVDGLSPLVGMLEWEDGALVLQAGEEIRVELAGGTDRMREASGSRVWVTTREDGRTIIRWGILRPPGP